jgi:hypothetical protein
MTERVILLERRVYALEILFRSIEHENKVLKGKYEKLLARHDSLAKDHGALVTSYIDSKKKTIGFLNDHNAEIKRLSVLAGNTAGVVFPKLDEAFREIDRKLGITAAKSALPPKKRNPPPKKTGQ